MTGPGPPPADGGSWLARLGRWWCLRAAAAAPRRSPAGAIFLLSAAWLAVWVAIDRWQRQPEPRFAADGIPLLAWYALGVLVLAALLRSRARPRPAFGAALVVALGAVWLPLVYVGVGSLLLTPGRYAWGASPWRCICSCTCGAARTRSPGGAGRRSGRGSRVHRRVHPRQRPARRHPGRVESAGR